LASVFAGFDIDATTRARKYFKGVLPSSPSIGILRDGELVYILERHQIENRTAEQIAAELSRAFQEHCAAESQTI
jgi:putative YphP/YqiW family bacilliredoxin